MATTKKYPAFQNRSKNRRTLGLRRGQGPMSTKKWIRDIYTKWFGRRDDGSREKVLALFQSTAQAHKAIQRCVRKELQIQAALEVRGLETPTYKSKGGGKHKQQIVPSHLKKVPRHIEERAQQAQLYLNHA